MILIIGYGSFGRKVVNYAKTLDRVRVVDKNPTVFESVEKLDFEYIVGDACKKETLLKAGVKEADTVIILTNDPTANKKIVELIKELNPTAYLIARGIPKYPDLYSGTQVNKVIYPVDCAAREIVSEIEKSKLRKRLMDLEKVIMDIKSKHGITIDADNLKEGVNNENSISFLILMHNNPDPDSIASAMALKRILERWRVRADIGYGGRIEFDENKAMINLLGIKLIPIEDIDINKYSGIAVVDTSSSKLLPVNLDREIDILIDHHENGDLTAKYMDIRPEIGATATIMLEYLNELGIIPKQDLATALYYAICSDTNYFRRKTSKKDFEAAGYLQDLMDPKILEMIENPEMDTETMEILARSVLNRKVVRSSIALSYVGTVKNRGALAKAADFLLKMEGITTTFVFGISGSKIHISARTKDLRIDVGEIMRRAFGGGGHQKAAAASIDLGIFESVSDKDSLRRLVEEAIQTKILEAMGISEEEEKVKSS
ncbi:NAD-binding protein [Methanothermococcus sp. SCGC AD-155-E23]|nr:NAD-binding protein [Methanothermococcus sp. SCGC AD-155-E23]